MEFKPGDIYDLSDMEGESPSPMNKMDDIARARLFRDLERTVRTMRSAVDDFVARCVDAAYEPERPRLRIVRDDEEPPCLEK